MIIRKMLNQIARVKKVNEITKKKLVRKEDKRLFVRRMQIYSRHLSKLEVVDKSEPLRIKTMVEIMKTMLTAAQTTKASKKTSRMSNSLSFLMVLI